MAMAAAPAHVSFFSGSRPSLRRRPRRGDHGRGGWKAMVQQQSIKGPAATYAREMERLSAKESLLLAFKDAGGFKALVTGNITELQKIDVNERIVSLERLNPTSRPSTSPFLEGRWNIEWFSDVSPGSFAMKLILERSPSSLAVLLGLEATIKDGYSKLATNLMLLNMISSKFLLTTRLTVEGPARMKEEYIEGIIEVPTLNEENVPEQLKGVLGQAAGTLRQLPAPITDAVANGLKLPLSGNLQRMFMISYLDEEILIVRNSAGAPDVLTRLEGPPSPVTAEPIISEYES